MVSISRSLHEALSMNAPLGVDFDFLFRNRLVSDFVFEIHFVVFRIMKHFRMAHIIPENPNSEKKVESVDKHEEYKKPKVSMPFASV